MALDPEELKKRRQKRDAQRRARQARKRKLLLRLGIAAVVLIGCGILIFTLSRRSAPAAETPPQGLFHGMIPFSISRMIRSVTAA